jgi:hypothetical protein
MRDATEDGRILTYLWQKMAILFPKNVPLTLEKPKEILAKIILNVSQSQKLQNLILLEVDGEQLLKKK